VASYPRNVDPGWQCRRKLVLRPATRISEMRWPRTLRRNTSLMTSRSGSLGIGLFALYHQLHGLDAIEPKVSQRIAKMAVGHQEYGATPL